MVPNVDVKIPTPSVGDIVSFSYESRARTEVPVNPKIYRIRSDISWDNLPRSSGDRIVQNGMKTRGGEIRTAVECGKFITHFM